MILMKSTGHYEGFEIMVRYGQGRLVVEGHSVNTIDSAEGRKKPP